jgi:hypothetical protein
MSSHDEKILLFLKFSHENKKVEIPLRQGSNLIHSLTIPGAICEEPTVLFNVFLLNKNEALIRSFEHFPLSVKFLDQEEETATPWTAYQGKQSLIKTKSILKTQIFAFKNIENNYFSFILPEELDYKQDKEEIRENQETSDETLLNFKDNQEAQDLNVISSLPHEETINPLKNEKEKIEEEKKNLNLNFDTVIIANNKIILDDDEEAGDILDFDEVKKKYITIDPYSKDKILSMKDRDKIDNNIRGLGLSNSEPQTETQVDTPTLILRHTRSCSNLPLQVEMLSKKRRRARFKRSNSLQSLERDKTNEEIENLNTKNKTCSLYENKLEKKSNKYVNESVSTSNTNLLNNKLSDSNSAKINLVPSISISMTKLPLPCSICLDPIIKRSSLDTCGHEFCKECIDQWALLSSHCPLCKEEFRKIISYEANQKIIKRVRKRKFKYDEEEEEPWYNNCAESCMVCKKSNDEHLLLVCDSCMYNICHTYCAGLDLIPNEDWNCADCVAGRGRGRERSNVSPNSTSISVPNQSINGNNNISNGSVHPQQNTPLIIKKSSRIIDDEEPSAQKNYSNTNSLNKPKSRPFSLGKKDREIAATAEMFSGKKNIRLLKHINGDGFELTRRRPRRLSLGERGKGYSLRRDNSSRRDKR